ncbi:hypothetical protein [Sphaerisporangium corydalis]|uniref:DUF1616 domain-containing protein n=1 Tax=Sphaerisporangium corydalis TaxID=1441875 RepID=A0ABV9ESS9_9ACTN|nr:hypothetical protein [Sphaerisporangium corydalis]
MYVSDQVGATIEPVAGLSSRLPAYKRAILVSTVLATVGLLLGAGWVWDRGLIVPVLPDTHGVGHPYKKNTGFVVTLWLTNRADHDVVLLGAGQDGRGLKLSAVQVNSPDALPELRLDRLRTTGFPATLGRDVTAELRLFYTVTDCSAVTAGPWPVPIRVRQWWGEMSVDLRPEIDTEFMDDAPAADGMNGKSRGWQRSLADQVCPT